MGFTIKGETVADDVYDLSESDSGAELTVNFDDRLDKLLEARDFDSALSLLDSMRNSEISNERYHFERLRLFFCDG